MNTTVAKTQMPTAGYGAALWRALKSFALLRESWVGMVGAFLVLFWVMVAILAPLLAPFDPNSSIQPFAKPGMAAVKGGGTFWLGTDHIGRDIMSRIIWGSRTVLIYAPLATLSAYTVGILMGLLAGYRRGWVDDVLSRLADIILSFPVLVLYIIIIATIGASGLNIIIAITFASSPGIMRIVRGLVLDLRNRDYVAAAQTRGESDWRVITIGVLGFLGLGLPPPDPDWGGMVNETRQMAMAFPHMTLFPCIAISSLILGFNLMADGLREISLRD
jgi:peptide/nickel transport system permease protein